MSIIEDKSFSRLVNRISDKITSYHGDLCHDSIEIYDAPIGTVFIWGIPAGAGTHLVNAKDTMGAEYIKLTCSPVYRLTKVGKRLDVEVELIKEQ